MQFLNPAVLVGLVAAAIPLALHLLHRGRARPLPFSNLAFLRRLHHSRMRRVRLRQWLVLLLRTLIILLVVCAFARPTYQSGGAAWGGGTVPTAAAVLLDLSYSTTYRLPSGPLATRLQQQVLDLLAVFAERDLFALIPFASAPGAVDEALKGERLRQSVRELVPTQETTDLNAALQAASRYLAAHPDKERELFLLSDLAHHNWTEVEDQRRHFPGARVYVAQLDEGPRPNMHIDAVRSPSWMPAAGEKLAIRIDLTNSAPHPASSTSLDLFVEGERVRHHSLDLAPGETVQVEFTIVPQRSGRLSGHVELEDDGLLLDNRRYFTVDVPERIGVLLLGAEPADTYFPRRALGAASLADPALELSSALLADLDEGLLQSVDVLVLCNLARLSAAHTARIHDFVSRGGGLILFPGPRADLNYYNRDLLPGLVPALFKGVTGAIQTREIFQILDRERARHPLFAQILPDRPEDQARFYASFSLTPRPHLEPLLSFTDGQLALGSGWKGRGRTVLAAFPLSLEWNDLPHKGTFAPLLHRLVRELSLPPDRHREYSVGQTAHRFLREVPVDAQVQAETPSGSRLHLEPELEGGQYHWKIPQLSEAGIWRLWRGDELVDRFAVNVDARESVLEPVQPERVARLFGGDVHFLRPGDDLRLKVLGNRYGRELWREFLVLAVLLLAVELWVARAPRDRPEVEK